VPLLTNTSTSTLLLVAVIVGAVPPAHNTPVNVAVNVPPCVRINVIEAPAVGDGIVNVQLPESVTVWTLPLARLNVVAVPLLPIATCLSKTTGMSLTEWLWLIGVLASDNLASFPTHTVTLLVPVGMRAMSKTPLVTSPARWVCGGMTATSSHAEPFH
jgi:hypothetical protein